MRGQKQRSIKKKIKFKENKYLMRITEKQAKHVEDKTKSKAKKPKSTSFRKKKVKLVIDVLGVNLGNS